MGNFNNQEQKDANATPHAKSERSEDAGSLKATVDENDEIPSAIHHLQQGEQLWKNSLFSERTVMQSPWQGNAKTS